MCKVLLFVDMEFPRGRGDQMEKSWRGGGSNLKKPSVGGGGGGGMDIFWNHTLSSLNPYMGSSWDPFLPLKSPTGCS